jgi:hypothetical protein
LFNECLRVRVFGNGVRSFADKRKLRFAIIAFELLNLILTGVPTIFEFEELIKKLLKFVSVGYVPV